MPIQHNRRVLIPVVCVRRHRVFLTERPACKRLQVISVGTAPSRCLPIVDVYTERTGLWPLLSLFVVALLCCSIFVAL